MISLDKYGIRLDALTAGTVDGVEVSAAAALSSGARVVCTLTAALPPDAVHLLAASGEMTPEAPTAQFSLYTEPMLPARLEFFDLAHQTVLAACTVQVQNSRLLWGDAAAGVPEAQIGLTRADLAQLEREIAEAKATVGEALAAGEETKKYAMAAASAAESARQSAAGSKRVANAAQEAAAAAQGAATAAQGAATAAQEAVNTHSARTDNPHGVTAAQVCALPLSGGTLSGAVGMQVLSAVGSIPGIGEADSVRNIVLVTTPDGEAPAVWLSGLAAGLEEGAAATLILICQNTGREPATFTIAKDDASRAVWRGLLPSDESHFCVSELSPGAFAFFTLLVWRRAGGATPLFLLLDYYRSDNVNVYNTMDPLLYSPSGKVFHLVVDDDGGLSSQVIV